MICKYKYTIFIRSIYVSPMYLCNLVTLYLSTNPVNCSQSVWSLSKRTATQSLEEPAVCGAPMKLHQTRDLFYSNNKRFMVLLSIKIHDIYVYIYIPGVFLNLNECMVVDWALCQFEILPNGSPKRLRNT